MIEVSHHCRPALLVNLIQLRGGGEIDPAWYVTDSRRIRSISVKPMCGALARVGSGGQAISDCFEHFSVRVVDSEIS